MIDQSIKIPRVLIETARNRAIVAIEKVALKSLNPMEAPGIASIIREAIVAETINEQLVPSGVLFYYACCEDNVKNALPEYRDYVHMMLTPLVDELQALPGVKAEFDKVREYAKKKAGGK